jgi:hypothetical protein
MRALKGKKGERRPVVVGVVVLLLYLLFISRQILTDSFVVFLALFLIRRRYKNIGRTKSRKKKCPTKHNVEWKERQLGQKGEEKNF